MISILNRFNNLTQRIIAALVGVAVMISSIVWQDWSFFGIFFLICMLSQLEFYQLVGLDGKIPLKFWGTFSGLSIFTLTFLVEKAMLSGDLYFLLFPILSFVFLIKLYRKSDEKPFTNIAFTFLGIIYVAIPFSLLNFIAFAPGYYSFQIVLGCLLLMWANDTGAYFAGVNFGKTKLFSRISPKKSWEGSIGGTIITFLVAYGLSYFFQHLLQWQWFTIAAIIVIVGTYGDLVESLFKRSMEIKDSGSAIPGHGGFLDRFDGLLLSTPFIAAFLKLF